MPRMKGIKFFQPPCGFGFRKFYGSRGSCWPILKKTYKYALTVVDVASRFKEAELLTSKE